MIRIGFVGAGRAGCGVGLALARAGHDVILHSRERQTLPVSLPHTTGGSVPPWLSERDVVVIAVPDDAVRPIAQRLAESEAVGPQHVVLHMSGVAGIEVIDPLRDTGAALGAFHPLQTLADPTAGPERLRGAVAAISGDERAVTVARQLAEQIGLHVVSLPDERRVAYHAAAVFASNYVVVLAQVASGLLADAGLSDADTRQALQRIIEGTAANIGAKGATGALTGPVVRGDLETIDRHLAMLPGAWRPLYRELARVALTMADLPEERRRAIEHRISASPPTLSTKVERG